MFCAPSRVRVRAWWCWLWTPFAVALHTTTVSRFWLLGVSLHLVLLWYVTYDFFAVRCCFCLLLMFAKLSVHHNYTSFETNSFLRKTFHIVVLRSLLHCCWLPPGRSWPYNLNHVFASILSVCLCSVMKHSLSLNRAPLCSVLVLQVTDTHTAIGRSERHQMVLRNWHTCRCCMLIGRRWCAMTSYQRSRVSINQGGCA